MNIIRGEQSCCIMIYGDIGDWGAVRPDDIVGEIMSAEREGRSIDIRINSVGGEVYAALAIFNALRASRADVTIYIDCLAASAASVIAGCGKPVKIASNGRIMIHSVRGGVEGTADEIKSYVAEMEQLENILCDIYSRRTGLGAEDVRARYFDGSDHWLSAQEALRMGFVDEIFDIADVAQAAPQNGEATPRQICNAYTRSYINSLNIKNQTMFSKLKARPRFTDCADEAAALSEVARLENEAAQAQALREERDALRAECDELRAQNDEYHRREQEAAETEIRNLAQGYVDAGVLVAEQRDNAESWLRADRAAATAYFSSLKPKRRIVDQLAEPDTSDADPLEQRKEEVRKRLGQN